MRNVIALALLLAFGAAAQAKYAPVDAAARLRYRPTIWQSPPGRPAPRSSRNISARRNRPTLTGRAFLCRPQRPIFDKTRLAQSCNR